MANKYFSNLIKVLLQIKNPDLMKDFLQGLLTPNEMDELGKRLEIVYRLLNNEPQHKIAKDLKVGIATVTRGSRELKMGRFKFVRNIK